MLGNVLNSERTLFLMQLRMFPGFCEVFQLPSLKTVQGCSLIVGKCFEFLEMYLVSEKCLGFPGLTNNQLISYFSRNVFGIIIQKCLNLYG